MKNFLLFAAFLLFAFTASAQEVIVGGDMEDEESWISYWRTDATDQGYINFNYKDDKPADGEAGCLEVYGYGTSGIFIFQEVTVQPGASYTFDGVIKNISTEPLTSTWVEFILSGKRPDDVAKADWGASAGDYIYAQNSWMAAPYNTMDTDGSFSTTYQFTWKGGDEGVDADLTGSNEITIPDTIPNTTWYVCFKAGCWNVAGVESPAYNLLLDNLSLINITEGNGVNELAAFKNSFSKAFPNPTNGLLNVELKSDRSAQYSLIDMTGKIVDQGAFLQKTSLNVNSFKKGIYLLKVVAADNVETHQILIK